MRVVLLNKLTRLRIEQIGIGQQRVLVVIDQMGGGIKGKQVVQRRRHFKGAFVAVALNPVNPLGIGRP